MTDVTTLLHSVTLYQGICIVCITMATLWELKRWKSIEEIQPGFIESFKIRSYLMLGGLMFIWPLWMLLFSIMSIVYVVGSAGNFYKKYPRNKSLITTLWMKVPVANSLQMIFWVAIDMITAALFLILVPMLCSYFFKDTILFPRLF